MLKFFRRIRQKLITEGNLSRYLIYAIGEIILVVIGILIALQINNWSQNNKDTKEEHQLLEKLSANIQSDTSTLKSGIIRVEYLLTLLDVIEKEMKDETLARFSVDLSHPLISAVAVKLETTTWDNLKSTGKLNLLRNDDLVDALQKYYNQFESVNKSWTDGFQSYNRGILAPKFFEFDDFSFFPPETDVNDPDIQRLPPSIYQKNLFFRNTVRYRTGALQSLKNIFEADYKNAISMLEMLNEEIIK